MGTRFSSSTAPAATAVEDTATASSTPSAKVITILGSLKEYYAAPFPASVVLADCELPPAAAEIHPKPSSFLCNADAIYLDAPVPALKPEDPVLPGGLYFELPDGMQRRPLSGAEMGALAVKASEALEAAGRRSGKKRVNRTSGVLPKTHISAEKEGSLDPGLGAEKQRSSTLSSAKRLSPTQLKKSAAVRTVSRQSRGSCSRDSSKYDGSDRSFSQTLGTIEEDGNR